MNSDLIPCWQTHLPSPLSAQTRRLLPTRGLLTLKLTADCGAPLQVQILFEGLAIILPDEAHTLRLPTQTRGWVRAVLLNCQSSAILYARSFIPLNTEAEQQQFLAHQHPFSDIKNLGAQPLGLWLVKHPTLKRTPFMFAQATTDYWSNLLHNQSKRLLTARQSVFERQQSQLLLTEVFLH